MENFVIQAQIIYSASPTELAVIPSGFAVCMGGKSAGVFERLPEAYASLPLLDFSDSILIPGLTDLHVHAPQYTFRSLGMDLELLPWLETYAFPEETRFSDLSYAQDSYEHFVQALTKSSSCRACIFATAHTEASILLCKELEKSGLHTFAGRVNMDRSAPEGLKEKNAAFSLKETERWISLMQQEGLTRTRAILTPRFIPSCSDELLQGLGELAVSEGLFVQSHLSENEAECALVKRLCPEATNYADAYARFNLFGGEGRKAIMAHCVLCPPDEEALLKERGVYVAHCPQSNTNLASGIAPIRRYLDAGIRIGLGSDVAGGAHLSIFRAMTDAIAVSKLYHRLIQPESSPLSFAEAFYLATAGGGSFFGQVGSFEAGYEFDALVLNEGDTLPSPRRFSLRERLERMVYHLEDRAVTAKFVGGRRLF